MPLIWYSPLASKLAGCFGDGLRRPDDGAKQATLMRDVAWPGEQPRTYAPH